MKIRRKVTIEVDRLTITVSQRAGVPSWCAICRAVAGFVEPNAAARLVIALAAQGMPVVESGLHFYTPAEMRTLICLNSIIGGNTSFIHGAIHNNE